MLFPFAIHNMKTKELQEVFLEFYYMILIIFLMYVSLAWLLNPNQNLPLSLPRRINFEKIGSEQASIISCLMSLSKSIL